MVIGVRPTDVTRTSGSATVTYGSEMTVQGSNAIIVPSIRVERNPEAGSAGQFAVDGRMEFVLHGVPTWAGCGLLELGFVIRSEVTHGPFTVTLVTADGCEYSGSFAVDGPGIKPVAVVFDAATGGLKVEADGTQRPRLGDSFGDIATQAAILTVRCGTVPVTPIDILGMEWRVIADPARGWSD